MAVQPESSVKDSLDLLTKKWRVDPKLYDLQTGGRDDVVYTPVSVGGVVFHIPTLSKDGLYVLWKCLWPDCHNCCERRAGCL